MCGRWQGDACLRVDGKTINSCATVYLKPVHMRQIHRTGANPMKSLAYEMKKEALCGLENNRTVKTYKESIERFAVWVKAT